MLGFWLYLMSDCLVFAVLFATYGVLGGNYAAGPGPKDLFDHQTLADLARAAKSISGIAVEEPLPADRFALSAADDEALSRALPTGAEVEDVYPLTPMQTGMLFHSAFDPSC